MTEAMTWTGRRWTEIIGLKLETLRHMDFVIRDEATELLSTQTLTVANDCLDEVYEMPKIEVTDFIVRFLENSAA